jgi:hypothetical protein
VRDTGKNKGDDDDDNVGREVSKRRSGIKEYNTVASMREKISMVLCSKLKSNWKKELYIEVCTQEARGDIGGESVHLEIKGSYGKHKMIANDVNVYMNLLVRKNSQREIKRSPS